MERCFGAAGTPLLQEGRILIGEGVLNKLSRKRINKRHFFLFNDILVYGTIIINKKRSVKNRAYLAFHAGGHLYSKVIVKAVKKILLRSIQEVEF